MNRKRHRKTEELIDYLEGELTPDEVAEIETHLAECKPCTSYVESLKRTFSLLATDTVPEPPQGYWVHFRKSVRHRIADRRRRLVLTLVPSLAAVLVVAFLIWWGVRIPNQVPDSLELILADMSSHEIVESVSGSLPLEEMVVEAVGADLISLEQYFIETENIYDLLSTLSEEEGEEFVSRLNDLMRMDSSNRATDVVSRKEC
jgi:predicted anti-sigma-YlaC factor YlaD